MSKHRYIEDVIVERDELLRALKNLRETTYDLLFGPRGIAECLPEELYAETDAAIAKAEGRK